MVPVMARKKPKPSSRRAPVGDGARLRTRRFERARQLRRRLLHNGEPQCAPRPELGGPSLGGDHALRCQLVSLDMADVARRVRAVRTRSGHVPHDELAAASRSHAHSVSCVRANDGVSIPKCDRCGRLCPSPDARRVGRVGRRKKRRSQRSLLDAHDVGLCPLRGQTHTRALRVGSHLPGSRTHGETDARNAAFRASAARRLAA